MNIIFIIIGNSVSSSNASILTERAKHLGDYFVIDNNHLLVETNLNTSELHEKIIGTDLQEASVIEILIQNSKYGTWGRAKSGLWDWLSSKTEPHESNKK